MTFTERASIESGFGAVFSERVAPALDRLEAERRAQLATARKHMAVPIGIGGLLALLALFAVDDFKDKLIGMAFPLVLGGLIAALIWKHRSKRWGGALAETVMPAVCDFLGDLSYDRKARDLFELDRMRALGLLPTFDQSKLTDRLDGRYRGMAWEMVEARLRNSGTGKDDSDRTVFQGLLMRVALPEPAPTTIRIVRDYGSVGNRIVGFLSQGRRETPRVELDHAAFEAAFEVHADDPDAARNYLPPAFLDNLLDIAEAEGGSEGTRGMSAGFHGEWFYLALSREAEFLEMGGLTRPVDGIEADIHDVFADISIAYRIIDRLHGDRPEAP